MTTTFTAADACALMEATRGPERRCVTLMHQMAIKKIVVSASHRQYECTFHIPMLMGDCGIYDITDVRNRLVCLLRRDGFRAFPLSEAPNLIYINWRPADQCRKRIADRRAAAQLHRAAVANRPLRQQQQQQQLAPDGPSFMPTPRMLLPSLRFNRPVQITPQMQMDHLRALRTAAMKHQAGRCI
jgi:hypothetical protein